MTQTPEARRLTNRRYYQKTKGTQNDKRKAWKAQFIAWFRSLKSEPCVDCGKTFHFAAMQFDHIGTDKLGSVSEVARRFNKQAVLEEIAKCELVCANCHAVRTWSRSNAGA